MENTQHNFNHCSRENNHQAHRTTSDTDVSSWKKWNVHKFFSKTIELYESSCAINTPTKKLRFIFDYNFRTKVHTNNFLILIHLCNPPRKLTRLSDYKDTRARGAPSSTCNRDLAKCARLPPHVIRSGVSQK